MGKRRDATRGGIEHGVVSHPTHKRDKAAFAKRRMTSKQRAFVAVEIAVPGADLSPFESKISGLGEGANWIVGRRGKRAHLSECDGDRWIELMSRIRSWANHYHQRQVRSVEIKVPPKRGAKDQTIKTKQVRQVGYYRRKVKDRVTLGPTDKHARKETDLMRETIDLRPDHSRALEYMMANRKMRRAVVNALDEIRGEKIRLFEEIYGRRVVGVGEHADSGQYHNDLWHVGIRSKVVIDDGGIVVGKDTSNVERGESKKVRIRNEFRQFGVSVGVASWDRHRAALEEFGADTRSLMGEEMQIIERNSEAAEKQNGESPRDLRLMRQLDAFVRTRLEKIDNDLCRRANEEYVRWLEDGYGQGKLGLMGRSQRVEKMEMELAEMRAQARTDAEHRQELNAMIAELEGEIVGLRRDFAQAVGAKEDVAKDLEKTKAERDGLIDQVAGLTREVSEEKTEKQKLEDRLETELADFDKLRVSMEEDYNEVCEKRDLLQAEKDGVEADLEALREDHDRVEKQLSDRDFKIQDLEKENRGLRFMESKLHALADLVMAFFLKLLGRPTLWREFRDDKPLFAAFDAMVHESSGKNVDAWVKEFDGPQKNVAGRVPVDTRVDIKAVNTDPTKPENP